ncbi:MAG: M23 family metallopeptidase [Chloroflexi bacterium]|nr:M23 family metallopeptidase [Chloroflexota bacterium]
MRRRRAYRHSGPTLVSPYGRAEALPRWRRLVGWLCLLAAIGLTTAAAYLVISAPALTVAAPVVVTEDAFKTTPTLLPETVIVAEAPSTRPPANPAERPTISPAQILELLATPPEISAGDKGLNYDPFTLVANRARAKMTSYVAQRGDTIDGIANRYGLTKESIAWCNDYRLALVLRPGDVVNIPPVDGACHTVIRTQSKDIRAIAEQYGVEDPYAIIDSAANDLPDIAPETLLPSGTRLFIPGGEGEIITWNAPVQQDGAGNVVAFDPGSPFSCGARSGGGTRWVNPLPNGSYVRGYYAGHSGIDIAAPTGTPIYAANGGPVLYAGWNNWGYGTTVVIGHGPWSTLYGHMSSRAVGCGQVVGAGQVIGYVGSTGNSSGPHLHFEIRFRNQPQDPAATSGIGW